MTKKDSENPAESALIQLFIRSYLKPILKETLSEILIESKVIQRNNVGDSEQLLTGRQVAKLLGVERHTVSSMIKKGLPFVLVGSKARRFKIEDVNLFIEDQKRSSKQQVTPEHPLR